MGFVKVKCPDCGKWLFEVAHGTTGIIKAFCKRCKQSKEIEVGGKNSE